MGENNSHFFFPKTILWCISLIPTIFLFISIAVGSYLHHFSPNELPKIYQIIILKPETIIFAVMLVIITILFSIITFMVFSYFGESRWVNTKTIFNQTMRYLLLIIGFLIIITLLVFLSIELGFFNIFWFSEKISEKDFSIYMVNSFIFLLFLFFFICDIIFLHIYRKDFFKRVAAYDILLALIILSIFTFQQLIFSNKISFDYQFMLTQFISICEYFLFLLLFFRFAILSLQMYENRKIKKIINNKKYKY